MASKARILIIDDNPDFVETLQQTLEVKSYEVITTSTM